MEQFWRADAGPRELNGPFGMTKNHEMEGAINFDQIDDPNLSSFG
ncbi:hypothetical protein [Caballeronia sp. EK]|nr:hypothetical protein [Caballeronia sp. EK]